MPFVNYFFVCFMGLMVIKMQFFFIQETEWESDLHTSVPFLAFGNNITQCGSWFWIAGVQLFASVSSRRIELSVFAWNTSRPYQTGCSWEHSGNAYHFWKKRKVYIRESTRCINTLKWDTKTRTWRLGPNRERCAANEGSLASQTNISLSVKQQV